MHLTLALSISGSINKTSVVVAVASLLGVALLALLFFAQAREVKRLREWASAASEREAELEARIVSGVRAQQARAAQLAQERPQAAAAVPRATPLLSRGAPQQAPAAAAAATAMTRVAQVTDVTEGAGAVAGVRATSAGTAVPGLPVAGEASSPVSAATPAARAGIPAGAAAAGAAAAGAAAAGAAAVAEGAAAAIAPDGAAVAPAAPAAPAAAPALAGAPAPVAGSAGPPLDRVVAVSSQPLAEEGASSRAARPPAPPAPPDSAAAPGLRGAAVTREPRSSRRTVDVGGGGSARRREAEAPSASRPVGRQATIYRKERSASRTLAIVVGGGVLLVLVVVLLVSVVSSGGSTPQASTKSASSHRTNTANLSSTKATLDVAVLNATETNGLAGQFANKLKGGGYAHARALYGTPSGTYPITTVQYTKGYQSEAMSVAHVIGVPASQVSPLLSSTQPLAAGASVVVIVGQSAAGNGEAAESSEAAGGEGTESSEASPSGEATEGTAGTEGTEGTEETAYGGEVPPESQTAEEGA